MVVLSKLFKEGLRHRQCNELFHSGGCIQNSVLNIHRFLISNGKFYFPFFLFSLLAKINKIDKNRLKNGFHAYIENVLGSAVIGWTTITLTCVFRKLLGEFNESSIYIPAMMGASLTLFYSERVQQFFKHAIIQRGLETSLMKQKNFLTSSIMNSTFLQTLIFMCASAFILYGKQRGLHRNFWIVSPVEKPDKDNESSGSNTCEHSETDCGLYFLKGLSTYFIIGLALDSIKALTSKTTTTTTAKIDFMGKLVAKFRKLNLRSTAFMCAYVSMYRLFHCYLNHLTGAKLDFNHILAAFLSGSSYALNPKLIILTFSITNATPVFWKLLKDQDISRKNKLLNFIMRLPLANVIYIAEFSNLVFTFCLRPKYVSGVGTKLFNGVTNNTGKFIIKNISIIEAGLK